MTGTVSTLTGLGRLLAAFPGADVVEGADLGTAAVSYAAAGLAVFPLAPRSKVPHKGSRGLLDATTNVDRVAQDWTCEPASNVGGVPPVGIVVIDVDPRNGGIDSIKALTAAHGPLPPTLRARSGGNDDGRHLWFRHPGGKLRTAGRPEFAGLDLRFHINYLVLPPSVHPDGGRYSWVDPSTPIADLPAWLVELLRPPLLAHHPKPPRPVSPIGDSVADWYTAATTWWDVLGPHGWHALDPDGTRWRHPTATAALSATVTKGCLFVYSTSTVFEPTGGGDPNGYTRFRAWATLEHGGDLSAAARAARQLREAKAA